MMLRFGLTLADQIVWFITISLNIGLLILLFKGNHTRLFPYFTAYNLFSLLKSLVLVGVRVFRNPDLYFYVYYIGLGIGIILLVAVVLEIAADTFSPYTTIPTKNVIHLLGLSTVSVISAMVVSQTLGWHPQVHWWDAILTLSKMANFLIVAGLGAILYVTYDMGLPMFKHNRGLAFGLLFIMLTQGIIGLITNPTDHARFFRPIWVLAYVVGQMVWIHTFFNKWVAPTLTLSNALQMYKDLEQNREQLSNQ